MDFPTPGSSLSPPAASSSGQGSQGYSKQDALSQTSQQGAGPQDASGINIRNPYIMNPLTQSRAAAVFPSDGGQGPTPSITGYTPSRSTSAHHLSIDGSQPPQDTGPENMRSIIHFNQSVLDAQAYNGSPVPIDGQFDTHVSILVAVYGWKGAQQKVDLDRRWLDFGKAVEDWVTPMSWSSRIAIILLGRWTLKVRSREALNPELASTNMVAQYYGDYGPYHVPAKPSLPTFLSPRYVYLLTLQSLETIY